MNNTLEVDTIYFGGGTPSLIPESGIVNILAALRSGYRVAGGCEISLEANPGTLSEEKMAAYRNCGVNRISIGAQSFVDAELAAIGRLHTPSMIHEAVHGLKRNGFQNLSLDLMLGLPFQTRGSWKHTLNTLAQLDIPHISIYMLDLDDKCPLSELVANGSIAVPDEDFLADMYLETIDFLAAHGYQQYEISNFARPGYVCRHNRKYWKREPVIGFGLASHSFDGKIRYANSSKMNDYLAAVENNQSPVDFRETVGPVQALQEILFLGLRMNEGIDWDSLSVNFEKEKVMEYSGYFRELSARDLLRFENGRIRLTSSGMLLSNEITQYFV